MSNDEFLLELSNMLDAKLESALQPIKDDIQMLKTEVKVHSCELQSLKTEVHQIKLFQENVILPRLNTIESCYLDTYKRYQRDADQMETVYEDVQLLKKVVAEHSERLSAPV